MASLLSDASATVQSQALRATGALMTATADGDAVLPLADLIPPMLQVGPRARIPPVTPPPPGAFGGTPPL